MRSKVGFKLLLATAALLGIAASGCSNSGPTGVYADILWQVRCQEMGMCTPGPERSILGFDRENGQRVSCSVIQTDTNRTLSFSGSFRSETLSYSLAMMNAQFPRSGGSPAAGCQITVLEDTNTYVGACGASPPTTGQPCQVSAVQFTRDDEGRSLIRGQIYCVGISPTVAPNIDREVTAPGPTAGTEPLTFSLYDCDGYTPD